MVLRSPTLTLSLFILSISYANQAPYERPLNWGVIEEKQAYRSRKLNSQELFNQINKYSIRSILCLAECTDAEKELSKILGIKYYDQNVNIPDITLDDADEIARTLLEAPKPILIHCRKGADRTGMAAALYYMAVKGEDPKKSVKKGLRLRYGHLGKLFMPNIHRVMNEYIGKNYAHLQRDSK